MSVESRSATDCKDCDPAGPTCHRCVALLEQEAEITRLRKELDTTRGRLGALGVEFDLAMQVIAVLRNDVADLRARVNRIEEPQS